VFPINDSTRGGSSVSPPEPYGQFLGLLQKLRERREAVSVITFNYDLALDYTLFRAKIPVDYGLSDGPADAKAVSLLKLHGSLHWVSCINASKTCGGIAPLNLEHFTTWKMEDRLRGERLRVSQALMRCPKCQGGTYEPRPVIVPPTWNKNHHHEGVASVWRHAAQRLRTASRIIVIGYSLPETDQFFRYLYALGSMGETRLRLFLVVNPNEQVGERFRRLLGRGVERRFLFRRWSFAGGMMPLAAVLIEGKEWKHEIEPENPSSNSVTWGR
jgi:NAD-dependent SIR2 family protein deacetylase